MPSIRILTLESKTDAMAVKCLANKLAAFLQLGPISIYAAGKSKSFAQLKKVVQNYLKQEDCVILIIDSDGPNTRSKRLQESNSLLQQALKIVNDQNFADKVFLIEVAQELEAWLLIDCIGIFCYYASKRPSHYRDNCRNKVAQNDSLKHFIKKYQEGNTENIVEVVSGGKGAKEYLIEFSKKVLDKLNPNLSPRNIDREKYQETRSPEVAEHIEINQETLRRNNSLKKLGEVIAEFQ